MTKRRSLLIQALILASLLSFAFAGVARADDKEFDAIAKHIKENYKGKRVRIPFMGLAKFGVKLIRPAGVKDFKVAIFENIESNSTSRNELSGVIRTALSQDWQPLVRIYSRSDNTQTYVYLREEGKNFKVMLVAVNNSDATVARAKFDPESLVKFLNNPSIMGIKISDKPLLASFR